MLRYYSKAADGTRRQHTRREWLTDDVAAAARIAQLKGEPPASAVNWSAAWQQYRAAHQAKRNPAYLDNMARDIRILIDTIGDLPVEETTLAHFSRFLDLRETTSGRTAQLARTHIHRVAKWLLGRGEVTGLQFTVAARPEYHTAGRTAASPQQFFAIAQALPDTMRPLWLAIGYTGARVTAMAELRHEHISTTHIQLTTKNRKIIHCKLTDPLRDAIGQASRHNQAAGRQSPYVFLNRTGTPWNRASFLHAIKRLRKRRPELPAITPHQLRHMWATEAAASDKYFSPDAIQAAMGHDDRRSAEAYIDHQQDVADAVADEVVSRLRLVCAYSDAQTSVRPSKATQERVDLRSLTHCPHCGRKLLPPKGKAPKSL